MKDVLEFLRRPQHDILKKWLHIAHDASKRWGRTVQAGLDPIDPTSHPVGCVHQFHNTGTRLLLCVISDFVKVKQDSEWNPMEVSENGE
jgi:hypothetical protein